MMLETKLRQAATALLESAIRIAPPDTRDWGRAMMGELNYLQSPWAATLWALGSSKVLAKRALVSLIIPGQGAQRLVPDGGMVPANLPLRKGVLATGGLCALAALLLFAAASFRQAFSVALQPWRHVYQVLSRNREPGLKDLAQKAENRRDAEGLAFCAISAYEPAERARWAEEAVRLDPNLTWVYAVIAMGPPGTRKTEQWADKLEQWDPNNALFRLVRAKAICEPDLRQGMWLPHTPGTVDAWQKAMAAAFRSTKYDDYLDRVALLNRRVVARYGFYDPYEVRDRQRLNLPFLVFEMSQSYAQWRIRTGRSMEAGGDRKGAREEYWTVARFGQLLDSQGRTDAERWIGTTLQSIAYKQLQESAGQQGNQTDAALFGYLATKFTPEELHVPWQPQESAIGRDEARRTANVVETLGVMILFFSVLVVIALATLITARLWSAPHAVQRARPVASWMMFTSALGLLISSVGLYVYYRPYWYMFREAIRNGGPAQTADLEFFLNSTMNVPWVAPHTLEFIWDPGFTSNFLFYAWFALALLGLITLGFIVLRHLVGRPRANAAV